MKKITKTLLLTMAFLAIPGIGIVSCSKDNEPKTETSVSEDYSGTYQGTITLNVAGQYSYDNAISCIIKEGDNKTISISFPEYSLAGTMMGDMTLGSVTITDIAYDETKGGFYRNWKTQSRLTP